MLFTYTVQSDVLSRDTTCRGIGHLVCARSRVPSPLSHRLQSQAKTALRTSHWQSCCSLAHYSQTFLAVTPPAEASVTLSVPVRAVPSPLSHRLQSQAKTALRTSHLQSCCSLAHYSQTFLAVTPPAEASVTLSVPVRAVPSPLSHRLQSQAKTALQTSHLQSCCSLAHYSQTFLAVTPPAEASVTLSVPVHEFHPLCLTGCRAKRKPHFEPHICSHVVHLHTTVRRS